MLVVDISIITCRFCYKASHVYECQHVVCEEVLVVALRNRTLVELVLLMFHRDLVAEYIWVDQLFDVSAYVCHVGVVAVAVDRPAGTTYDERLVVPAYVAHS